MRNKKLRFTGENPPPELWREFPNWWNAFGEEGLKGQDETTLMPHDEQRFIGEYTTFTGGSACFNDGRIFPAFLAVDDDGQIDGCEVYEYRIPWRIYFDYPKKKWVAFSADWLPGGKRPPFVSLSDKKIFPIEVRMHVPWKKGGKLSVFKIDSRGKMRNAKSA